MTKQINKYIANQAKQAARTFILEGFTQLQNNDYSSEKRASLVKGVRDMRTLIHSLSQDLDDFYYTVEWSKKLSLGNCYEGACIALDYVITHEPFVRAEIYEIKGGDHIFLVIGRTPHTNPEDPTTWNDEVYICDPWANKVYPARKYLTELKNYVMKGSSRSGHYTNQIEDFDIATHGLSPISYLNTTHLRPFNFQKKQEVIQCFNQTCRKMLNSIITLEEHLNGLHKNCYFKREWLTSLTLKTHQLKESLQSAFTHLSEEPGNYLETHARLTHTRKQLKKDYLAISQAVKIHILNKPNFYQRLQLFKSTPLSSLSIKEVSVVYKK